MKRLSVVLAMIMAEEEWNKDISSWISLGMNKVDFMKSVEKRANSTFWISEKDAQQKLLKYKVSYSMIE